MGEDKRHSKKQIIEMITGLRDTSREELNDQKLKKAITGKRGRLNGEKMLTRGKIKVYLSGSKQRDQVMTEVYYIDDN